MLVTQHFAISSFILLALPSRHAPQLATEFPYEIRKGEHLTISKIKFCKPWRNGYNIPRKEITDIKWTRAVLSTHWCIKWETNGNENFILLLIKPKQKKAGSCIFPHLHTVDKQCWPIAQWATHKHVYFVYSFFAAPRFLWGLASSE